jgi:nucleoside-diphosphate-sugar epimerase
MTSNRSALVLGATGGVGGEVARRLIAAGWTVHALKRDPAKLSAADKASGLVWHRGDAMSAADDAAAAAGGSVTAHAVNPRGYRNWGKFVLPMLDNTIAAARANGARIVLPGTVYNFGPDAFPDLRETSPQNPVTAKGRIRVEMERRLREAASTEVGVLIVRAGDFFGPKAGNNWFSQGLVKAGKPISAITYPGKHGIGHQWAYLPDVAQTMARLLEKSDMLETFRSVPHGRPLGCGRHPNDRCDPKSGRLSKPQGEQDAAVADAYVGALRPALWGIGGNAISLEHSYPHGQCAPKSLARVGAAPLDKAVRETLIGLGCLSRDRVNSHSEHLASR